MKLWSSSQSPRPELVATLALVALCSCASTTSNPPAGEAAAGTGPGSIAAATAASPEPAVLEALNTPARIESARRRYGEAEFLGEATIVSGTELDGSVVGGLSGITWTGEDRYAVISDDRGSRGAGRFYTARIDLSTGYLERAGFELLDWTALRGENGSRLVPQTFDPEGIAAGPDATLYISSEGVARAGIPPFVGRFGLDGAHLDWVPLPPKLVPSADGSHGVRDNLALETLSITPDGATLFTAVENALLQDGPKADYRHTSPTRIIKIDLETGRTVGEYVYIIDRVPLDPAFSAAFHTAGLVDMAALDGQHLLALERSFVAGSGFTAKVHWVCLEEATNVVGLDSLTAAGLDSIRTVRKEPFLDLDELGIRLDNMEGMGLGAPLPAERRALLLISDNNFNTTVQITQLLAFAVPADIRRPH